MGTLFDIDHATGIVDFKQKGTENLVLEKGTSFPGVPSDGHLFYRTDLTQLFVYDNGLTDWKTQAGGSLRIYNETPSGTVDGVNTVFTVVNQYVAGTTIVTRNGLVMKPGDDYTETTPSTGTITFAVAPTGGSIILVSYSRTIGQDVPKLLKFTVETGTPSGTYTGSTTVFDLPFSYTPGTGSLLVFSGGVIMAVGAGADYQETDSNTVTFNSARTGGEVVQFLKLGVANDLGNTGGWVESAGAVTVETLTNQVLLGDGSASEPALAFDSGQNKGIYSILTRIGFSTGGVERVRIGNDGLILDSGQFLGNDGTASAPTYTWGADDNTGFYRRGTDSIGFAGGGVEIGRIEGSGIPGNTTTVRLTNPDNTNGGSNARLYVDTGGASSGDPFILFQVPSVTSWSLGLDNSDGDAFILTNASTLNGANFLKVSTSGTITFSVAQEWEVRSISTSDSLAATDHVVLADASGGTITLTLPTASGKDGRVVIVKKTDSSVNSVVIDADGSETIDGNLTYQLTVQYESVTIVASGTSWFII